MIKSLVSLKPLEKFPEKFLEITESFLVLCQIIVSFSFSLSFSVLSTQLYSSISSTHLLSSTHFIYSHLSSFVLATSNQTTFKSSSW